MRIILCGILMLCGACGAGDLTRDNPNDRTNAACGNGAVDPGELCDDANAIDEDGCRRDCTLAFCGDGVSTANLAMDGSSAAVISACAREPAPRLRGSALRTQNTGSSVQQGAHRSAR